MGIREKLLLLGSVALLPTTFANAQTAPLYTLNGIVRDGGAAPVASAELALSRGGERARLFRTGEDGTFSFSDLPPGPMLLKVRRLGYKLATINVDVGPQAGDKSLEIQLSEIPSSVEDVIVESKGHLQEFYAHKASNNFAKFFERRDIERQNPGFLSEMLRTVPGASLQSSSRSGNLVLLRGCKPMVWVDGMRAPGAELDEVARPTDIAGLEVYPSSAGLPPQYQDRNNRMCGAILIWTRNQ